MRHLARPPLICVVLLLGALLSGCGDQDQDQDQDQDGDVGGVISGIVHSPRPLGLGRVTFGAPAAITVSWIDPSSGKRQRRETDIGKGGGWSVADVPLDVDLRVKLGYGFAMDAGCVPLPSVVARAGDYMEWQLVEGETLTGRCVLPDGEPVGEHVYALASAMNPDSASPFGATRVVRDGAFLFRGLEKGAYSVKIQRVASQIDEHGADASVGDASDLLGGLSCTVVLVARTVVSTGDAMEVRIPRQGSLRVDIAGMTTEPATFEATLYQAGTTWRRAWISGSVSTLLFKSGDGGVAQIVFAGVPEGRYDLVLQCEVTPCAGWRAGVSVGETVRIDLGDAKPLSGSMRRADGSSGALRGRLYAVREGGAFDLLIRDDGEFACESVAAGSYELHYVVFEDGKRKTTVVAKNVESGSADLNLVLGAE